MFKPGDKVRAKDKTLRCYWKNHPKIMEVLHVANEVGSIISIAGNPRNGKSSYDETKNWVYDASMFELCEIVDSIPPETIEHEGYTYTRGEKIAPSWLKDGEWLTHKFDGGVRKVRQKGDGVYDIMVTEDVGVRYHEGIKDQYRSFKETDWKWGMCCEYSGSVWLLFINPSKKDGTLWANLSKDDSIICVKASEITLTFKR